MATARPEPKPPSGITGKLVSIASTAGGMFDCYLVTPTLREPAPAMVLAAAVYGVDADIRAIADEFAHNGYIAAAPDLFWRSIPGPLPSSDKRTRERSEPRLERIKMGEADIADTLAYLRRLPGFNGRAALMGFCYGGPYAIIGPKRLGYAAGVSCHGSQMLDYLEELEGLGRPVCVIWGDKDHRAPAKVLDAYRVAAMRTPNLDLHIFPGIQHGYMMPGIPLAFDQKTRDFSMGRAFSLLEALAAKVVGQS